MNRSNLRPNDSMSITKHEFDTAMIVASRQAWIAAKKWTAPDMDELQREAERQFPLPEKYPIVTLSGGRKYRWNFDKECYERYSNTETPWWSTSTDFRYLSEWSVDDLQAIVNLRRDANK